VGTKQQILRAIEELPDDAGVEDALDRLYLLYKVERGLRQADRGELISQEEVCQRPRFAPEPAPGIRALGSFVEGLDGYGPPEALIPALVHYPHPALADLAPDTIVADDLQHTNYLQF